MTTVVDRERLDRFEEAVARACRALRRGAAGANGNNGAAGTSPRLSVDEYHELLRTGVLTEDDPLELLEGVLVLKMGKNPPHRFSTERLREILEGLLPPGWHVNVQEPITLEDGEPEPDISAIKGSRRDYLMRHPAPTEVGLLVEVSDASLGFDRGPKKGIYARARILVYWIVSIPERKVEVYTQPSGSGADADYQQCQEFGPGDAIPVFLDGREIGRVAVHDILL